jgi:AcrR family transcriptional regulator
LGILGQEAVMAKLAERRKELLDSMMKEAVYEGAVAVLTEYGLNGTTMDRVAAASGMAKGSLYNCFRSKQELLEFVHDRVVTPLHEAIDEVVEGSLDAGEKLAAITRLWREHLVEHQAVFHFLINDQGAKQRLRNTEQSSLARGIKQVATILRQGIQEGMFRAADVTAVAEMLISAAVGMVEQEYAAGKSREVDEAVELLMSVFLHGLVVRPQP